MSGLAQRAADLLRGGPVHTLDLARDVLGLEGHPGAASAAVFALLGSDDRFRVDGEGRWSLGPGGLHLGRPLASLPFAVVDVETTGGPSRSGHRIVEIAIVEVRDGRVAGDFRTLVNPARGVPRRIQSMTGITPSMLRGAPEFQHIAPEVVGRLEERVFVAHNVRFDWQFVSDELVRAGWEMPEVPRLCTVRMARRLVKGLRRRNLDALTRHFDIPVPGRHRAWGDALATARVLLRLLDEAGRHAIHDLESLRRFLRRPRRGSHSAAQPELFDDAPSSLQEST